MFSTFILRASTKHLLCNQLQNSSVTYKNKITHVTNHSHFCVNKKYFWTLASPGKWARIDWNSSFCLSRQAQLNIEDAKRIIQRWVCHKCTQQSVRKTSTMTFQCTSEVLSFCLLGDQISCDLKCCYQRTQLNFFTCTRWQSISTQINQPTNLLGFKKMFLIGGATELEKGIRHQPAK